jgi:hypothetical protein
MQVVLAIAEHCRHAVEEALPRTSLGANKAAILEVTPGRLCDIQLQTHSPSLPSNYTTMSRLLRLGFCCLFAYFNFFLVALGGAAVPKGIDSTMVPVQSLTATITVTAGIMTSTLPFVSAAVFNQASTTSSRDDDDNGDDVSITSMYASLLQG